MPTVDQARQFYLSADPVHDFEHIQRVLNLAERVGREEGADLEILRAAVLLHDAAGATPGDEGQGAPRGGRATHHEASADFARGVLVAEGWSEERIEMVLHCIRAHRFRSSEAPRSLEAKILYDCDKLDVLGAIGVARAMAYAALAGQPLTGEPSEKFKASGEKEPGEPHTPYHEFLFKLSRVKDRMHTPTTRAIAEARHIFLQEYFERLRREVAGKDIIP